MSEDADFLSDLDQLRSRYNVLRRLGSDGGCAVYAVRGRGAEQHYLVKVMRKPGSGSAQAGTLHLWQAHTMERLEHPKLLALHTVNHLQGGTLALAMERRRGQTLAERIESVGPLPIAEVEGVLRDVAEALAYLHGRGVVHRGINLDSVLLDRDSECARLAHFGIPRAEGSGEIAGDAGASAPQTGAYDGREQGSERATVRDYELSPRSDLYSLGLVGYALLAGRDPRARDAAAARMAEPLPPLATIRTDAPPYLCRAIEGCLEWDPRRRWRSAEEFLLRLDPSAEHASIEPPREMSGMRVGSGGPLDAIRWDSVRQRNLALALPAVLLAALVWGVLRPAGAPAPPAAAPPPVTSAVATPSASTRPLPVEPSGASAPISAITDLPNAEIESTPARREPEPEPAAEPANSGPRSPARRSLPAAARPNSKSAPGGQPAETASRRPPVPLLGEELP